MSAQQHLLAWIVFVVTILPFTLGAIIGTGDLSLIASVQRGWGPIHRTYPQARIRKISADNFLKATSNLADLKLIKVFFQRDERLWEIEQDAKGYWTRDPILLRTMDSGIATFDFDQVLPITNALRIAREAGHTGNVGRLIIESNMDDEDFGFEEIVYRFWLLSGTDHALVTVGSKTGKIQVLSSA